jgi:hypothetical protein
VQAEKGVQKYAFCAASEENGRQHVHVSIFFVQNTNKHFITK